MALDPGNRNEALNPSDLHPATIAPMYRADRQYTLGAVLKCAFCRAPREQEMRVRLLTFLARSAAGRLSLRDDWEWQLEWDGAGSNSVAGIGVGSAYPSSSRSAESDYIVREKSTAVAELCLIVPPLAMIGPALGIMGSMRLSSVPPPLWPLSEVGSVSYR